ncbi:hypothetical protein [Polaromonas sp.]|uniref:hypothetical protein n=1 Tax=Polaromonas sp. TaxID=1869339 RepID=UPI00352BB467
MTHPTETQSGQYFSIPAARYTAKIFLWIGVIFAVVHLLIANYSLIASALAFALWGGGYWHTFILAAIGSIVGTYLSILVEKGLHQPERRSFLLCLSAAFALPAVIMVVGMMLAYWDELLGIDFLLLGILGFPAFISVLANADEVKK